jgi:acetyltransferase-like isoleucine patch superfamily enzyme
LAAVEASSSNDGAGPDPAESPGAQRSPAKLWRGSRNRLIHFEAPRLASALRKRWAKFKNPKATIRFGKHVYAGPGFSLHMPFGGTFIVGDGVEFRRGFRAEIESQARVIIGPESRFTYYVLIQCGASIEIGARCIFGQSTMVVDGNHRFRDLTQPMLKQGYDYRPIRIADDAVVTTKCTIIAEIGTRAFIAANSVVSRPIPPYTVAAGVPARVIDYFGPPGEEPAGWDSADRDASSQASRK